MESDVLFNYSEWLDQQGLVVSDRDSEDKRSHEQLVKDFMDNPDWYEPTLF